MKLNYKKLGDHIRETDIRDAECSIGLLLGVSIQKIFIPSIANTIGTDMSSYKIIKRNQFAYGPVTSRNGDKVSIALLEKYDQAIVSQAYITFEIIDVNKLLPEYLMMWFRRPEFDRYARFKSHGSAREIFDWEEMCNVDLPVPPIEKQREIVKEYNVILDRIKLNNQLIAKLEETAQAIYKQWFVDFEFPDKNGKPYKSSGGEMVWCEELEKDIPKGWKAKLIFDISNVQYGYPFDSELFCLDQSLNPIIRIRDIKSNITETFSSETVEEKYLIKDGDLLIGMDGEFHLNIWFGGKAYQNQRIVRLRSDKNIDIPILQISLSIKQPIKDLENTIEGTTVAHLSDTDMKSLFVLVADSSIQKNINEFLDNTLKNIIAVSKENVMQKKLLNILLQKIATITT